MDRSTDVCTAEWGVRRWGLLVGHRSPGTGACFVPGPLLSSLSVSLSLSPCVSLSLTHTHTHISHFLDGPNPFTQKLFIERALCWPLRIQSRVSHGCYLPWARHGLQQTCNEWFIVLKYSGRQVDSEQMKMFGKTSQRKLYSAWALESE
jgi:hypothetical protein